MRVHQPEASGSFTLDHSKYDPMDEEFMKRNKLFPQNMNRVKQNLRNQNSMKRFGKNTANPLKSTPKSAESNKTKKHIMKYD